MEIFPVGIQANLKVDMIGELQRQKADYSSVQQISLKRNGIRAGILLCVSLIPNKAPHKMIPTLWLTIFKIYWLKACNLNV